MTILNHVALVLDGNRRWAVEKGLPIIEGYRRGAERVREIMTHAIKKKIPMLTMYFFSTENWRRSPHEVSELMQFMEDFLYKNIDSLVEEGISLRYLGRQDRLPSKLMGAIHHSLERTALGDKMVLNIALDYGGRDEILRAVERILQKPNFDKTSLNEEVFRQYLDASGVIDPDLMIRTGGEMRLSNFLLWQVAYSELFFTKVLWPDFTTDELDAALIEFQQRNRRRGGDAQSVSRSI